MLNVILTDTVCFIYKIFGQMPCANTERCRAVRKISLPVNNTPWWRIDETLGNHICWHLVTQSINRPIIVIYISNVIVCSCCQHSPLVTCFACSQSSGIEVKSLHSIKICITLKVFLTSQSNLLNNLDNLLEVLMKLQASF